MALGGCYSCIKYLMFAFNFLFWLLGCAILGVGIWIRVDPNFKKYIDISHDFNYLYTGAYILIAIGIIVMVTGFLGCCGAIRESQCMLCMFFVFLFVIFAVLLGAGIWAVLEKNQLKTKVTEILTEKIKNYNSDPNARKYMDDLQNTFDCCGADEGWKDYKGRKDAPESCKGHEDTPCTDKLFDLFSENMIIVAGVAIGIGVIMLLGMIFSMCLCCAIREESA